MPFFTFLDVAASDGEIFATLQYMYIQGNAEALLTVINVIYIGSAM